MNGGRLLIDEPPLQVLPSLACEIGLNESVFVQQLHYWLNSPHAKEHDGRRWIYNTYEAWNEQFPFWSYDTIKRVIRACETKGYIETTSCFNNRSGDRTKWYTINYEALGAQAKTTEQQGNMHSATGQYAPTEQGNLHSALPETTQRLTTENSTTEEKNAQAENTEPEPIPDDTTTQCLQLLLQVNGFSRDQGKNAIKVAEYRAEYPGADAVEVCKDFRAYSEETGKPPTLLRLRNFFKQAAKSAPTSNGHYGKAKTGSVEEGYEWLFNK